MRIDPELLEATLRAGGHATKRETVHAALTEYVQRRKRRKALAAFGTFDFAPSYNYKHLRRAR